MRIVACLAALAVTASCSSSSPETVVGTGPAAVSTARVLAASKSVDEERQANEGAYRFLYLPEQKRLTASNRGQWLAIVDRRIVPAQGPIPAPAKTMEEADAAARTAAPSAAHRFVFQIGEEGDVKWPMGGCELPHVLGTYFMQLLERDDVATKMSTKRPSIAWKQGDKVTELAVSGNDNRMYVRPEVGPPGARRAAAATYCVSTGFGGFATMSPESAAGLELWEIPGTAHVVDGVAQNGECRRARARFSWPGTPLEFMVPVAIWPR